MSEGKGTNFFDKLKTDKKFRFEFIMAIWSGIVGIALVIGLVFVGKTFFFGKKVVDSGDLEDKPAVVTEQAVDAEETPAPYDSAIVSENEEDFQDAEDYIRREFADDCAENKCKTKICEQAYLQGRMYYYYIVSFKDMHARFQKLVAACDIRPGEIYTVDADWVDKKEVLTINAVSLFLDIAVSEKK